MKEGSHLMHAQSQLRLELVNERIALAHHDAAEARLADAARHRHRRSLRRVVGRLIIAIGERLAAEPALDVARAR